MAMAAFSRGTSCARFAALQLNCTAAFIGLMAVLIATASSMSPATAQDTPVNSKNMPLPDSANHLLDVGDYIAVQVSLGGDMHEYEVQLDSNGAIVLPLLGSVVRRGLSGRDAPAFVTPPDLS